MERKEKVRGRKESLIRLYQARKIDQDGDNSRVFVAEEIRIVGARRDRIPGEFWIAEDMATLKRRVRDHMTERGSVFSIDEDREVSVLNPYTFIRGEVTYLADGVPDRNDVIDFFSS